jgi:GT2 family glycosyltransferase
MACGGGRSGDFRFISTRHRGQLIGGQELKHGSEDSSPGNPLVTVVVPTIDRGAAIADTIASILQCDYQNREVIVVDQSQDDRTALCLRGHIETNQVLYLRAPRVGVAFSRETGAREGSGELIAYVDDDCVVAPSWLPQLVRVFQANSQAGMLFGNVLAAPHNCKLGFVQSYVRRDFYLATSAGRKHRVEGIGACMAIRRSVWRQVGGFDLALGAGSTYRAAEETDLAFRVLLAGHGICETPDVSVVHSGFRSWTEHPRIVGDYLYGLGAMAAKHLRCGQWQIITLMFHLGLRWAFQAPVANLGARAPRLLRLQAYLKGLAAGFRGPLDRRATLYRTALDCSPIRQQHSYLSSVPGERVDADNDGIQS